jgi:hypothetical protein
MEDERLEGRQVKQEIITTITIIMRPSLVPCHDIPIPLHCTPHRIDIIINKNKNSLACLSQFIVITNPFSGPRADGCCPLSHLKKKVGFVF